MSRHDAWQRVGKAKPCPICERPDWCLIAADGGAAICARIESPKRAGEAGYLHRLRDDHSQPRQRVRTIPLRQAEPCRDLADRAAEFRLEVDPSNLNDLTNELGLSAASLESLGIGWAAAHGAWSFPMIDASSAVLGIRLRKPDGFKFSVKGGKEGLFLPSIQPTGETLFIVEGATDTAALLDFGITNVVGRPSCTGGLKLLVELIRARKPKDVVIVADTDEPGQRGAGNLASVLLAYVPSLRTITPPDGIKDVRAWLRAGGTISDLQALVNAAPVRRLTIRSIQNSKAVTHGR